MMLDKKAMEKRMKHRFRLDFMQRLIILLAVLFALSILLLLLYTIIKHGMAYLNFDFLTSFSSRKPMDAGIAAALWGTIALMTIVTPTSLLLGVGTALYLEEYKQKTVFTQLIELNIQTLAGVPSVVFGLLGLTVFVYGMGLGQSLLAGALTISLMSLPTIIVTAQEAVRAVPKSLREASYAVGATKWQTIRFVVLPTALPGIITGCILSLSRAIGEAAPLLVIGALAFMHYLPISPLDGFTVLPIQIFNWMNRPQEEFHAVAAAGILVLLVLLLTLHIVAVLLRNYKQKRY